jgi:hypothetical protein
MRLEPVETIRFAEGRAANAASCNAALAAERFAEIEASS